MESKEKFLKTYLLTAFIFGIVSLSDSILTFFNVNNLAYNSLLIIFSFLFFFFNILSISIFHHHRIKRIVFLLPTYHILAYILFLGLGIYLSTSQNVQDIVWNSLLITGFVTSLFEIIFSLYLLRRFYHS